MSDDDGENSGNQQLSLPVFTPPTIGERIHNPKVDSTYIIGSVLGNGAFSNVYYCEDDWGNKLAAKVLLPRGTYERVKQSYLDEYQKLVMLRHPNITFIKDAFEYRDTFYIITEMCSDTINVLIDNEKYFPELWIRPLSRCVLQGLQFIHGNGYVHKDLHMGNIMINHVEDELVPKETAINFKIADLGVSNLVSKLNPETTVVNEQILPPEFLNHKNFGPIGHTVDLYQFGLILLQMLIKERLVFTKEEILDGAPRKRAESIVHPFAFAIAKALRRHATSRTASAKELWRDLNVDVSV